MASLQRQLLQLHSTDDHAAAGQALLDAAANVAAKRGPLQVRVLSEQHQLRRVMPHKHWGVLGALRATAG